MIMNLCHQSTKDRTHCSAFLPSCPSISRLNALFDAMSRPQNGPRQTCAYFVECEATMYTIAPSLVRTV